MRVNSFNTQPPEGGWIIKMVLIMQLLCFNTQPPEGGWVPKSISAMAAKMFQHTAA